MILGLSVEAFTKLHVAISLVAILAGFVAVLAMIARRRLPAVTMLFLATTILTSATGFLFHSAKIGPPHIVGLISLVVLAVALVAFYGRKLAGVWRPIYVVCAVLALYLNVFVAIVQAFQKLPGLAILAPTQTEPPFVAAQAGGLVVFVLLGVLAWRNFRSAPTA